MRKVWFLVALLCSMGATAEKQQSSKEELEAELSYYHGYKSWAYKHNDGIHGLNIEEFIKGVRAAARGETLDKERADRVEQFIRVSVEDIWKYKCSVNLEAGELFLREVQQRDGVQELRKDKLYVEVISKGAGESPKSPVYTLTVEGLNNTIWEKIYSTAEPTTLDPETVIEGVELGIRGMKHGERRKLYIHPELAYGEYGTITNVPPQCTLMIEVECKERALSTSGLSAHVAR